jgi:hypothetical protein
VDTCKPLYPTVKPYTAHVLVFLPDRFPSHTWPPDIFDDKPDPPASPGPDSIADTAEDVWDLLHGLLLQLKAQVRQISEKYGRNVLLTVCEAGSLRHVLRSNGIAVEHPASVNSVDLVIYPHGAYLSNVDLDVVQEYPNLIETALQSSSTPPVPAPLIPSRVSFMDLPLGEEDRAKGIALVLVCAHVKRDRRCGVIGPALINSVGSWLSAKGLHSRISVHACSHIGGAEAHHFWRDLVPS